MATESSVTPSYTPDRLRRAFRIITDRRIERAGPHQFRVAGNHEPEYGVDLTQTPSCHCKDTEYRHGSNPHPCKHTLAARLMNGDTDLLIVVGTWLMENEKNR